VSGWPAPSLIPDEPADGTALQVGLVVRTQHPEGHAIGEVLGGRLELVSIARVEGFDGRAFVEDVAQAAFGLVTGVIVGLVQPQGRPGQVGDDVAEADFADGCLGGLNRGEDRHDPDLGIDQSL
jgi:hypothetical protein